MRRRAAAKEQKARRHLASGTLLDGAFLQEAPHGRKTGAGAEHDERDGGVTGWVKRGVGRAHRHLDPIVGAQVGKVCRGDAKEGLAATGYRGGVQDADGQCRALRIDELGGRDRVLSDAHTGEQTQECAKFDVSVVMIFQYIQDAQASCEHPLGIVGQ